MSPFFLQSSRRQWLTAVLSHHRAYGSVLSGSLNLILCPYFTLKYKSPATYYHLFPTYSRKWESFFWLVWLLIIFYMFHWQIIINVLSFAPYSFLYFITTTTRTDFLMFSYTSLDSISSRPHTVSVNTFISSTRHIYYINLV